MICRWINKNVDLELITQKVEAFFNERHFRARLEKTSSIKYVVYILVPREQKRKIVTAKIYGKPNDFLIEFPAEDHSFSRFGSLMSLFGGGFLVLKETKDKELLRNLQDEFWICMEKFIEDNCGKAL